MKIIMPIKKTFLNFLILIISLTTNISFADQDLSGGIGDLNKITRENDGESIKDYKDMYKRAYQEYLRHNSGKLTEFEKTPTTKHQETVKQKTYTSSTASDKTKLATTEDRKPKTGVKYIEIKGISSSGQDIYYIICNNGGKYRYFWKNSEWHNPDHVLLGTAAGYRSLSIEELAIKKCQ